MELLKNYENRAEKRALMQRNKRTAKMSNTSLNKAEIKPRPEFSQQDDDSSRRITIKKKVIN